MGPFTPGQELPEFRHCEEGTLPEEGVFPSAFLLIFLSQETLVAAGRFSHLIKAECPAPGSHQPQSERFKRLRFL